MSKCNGCDDYPNDCVNCENSHEMQQQQEPPQTNGDRIRSMTDEQLAELLAKPKCTYCSFRYDMYFECDDKCMAGLSEWLQQTALHTAQYRANTADIVTKAKE